MKIIKNNLLFLYFIVAVICIRTAFLLIQPPFLDETIYLITAKNIFMNHDWVAVFSLAKLGVPPIFIYLSSIAYAVVRNPIFAGRLTSLLFYGFAIIILKKYFETIHAPGKWIGIIFFAINPFIFLYSQMAMIEMTSVSFVIIFLYLTEKLINKPSWSAAFILAISYLFTILTKYTSIFFIIYLFIRTLQMKKIRFFIMFCAFLLVSILPFFLIITETTRALLFHATLSRQGILSSMRLNSHLVYLWTKDYFQLPIIFITIYICVIALYRKNRVIVATLTTYLTLLIFFIITATNFFPRYLILSTVIFAIIFSLINYGRLIKYLIFFLLIFLYLPAVYLIMFNLKKAPIALEDRYQYATDWTSGKNVVNLFHYLRSGDKICTTASSFSYFDLIRESYFPKKKISIIRVSARQSCPTGLRFVSPN